MENWVEILIVQSQNWPSKKTHTKLVFSFLLYNIYTYDMTGYVYSKPVNIHKSHKPIYIMKTISKSIYFFLFW